MERARPDPNITNQDLVDSYQKESPYNRILPEDLASACPNGANGLFDPENLYGINKGPLGDEDKVVALDRSLAERVIVPSAFNFKGIPIKFYGLPLQIQWISFLNQWILWIFI